MINNIKLSFDSNFFKDNIDEELSNNLPKALIIYLAGLLAIDYSLRLKDDIDLNEHIKLCITRLVRHLNNKIIFDEGFSSALTLFAVAISPDDKDDSRDEKNIVNSKEAIIDSVIASNFGDLSIIDQNKVKLTLIDLLNEKDGAKLIDLLTSNPKLFHTIVKNAIGGQKQQEISTIVISNLRAISAASTDLLVQKNKYKALFTKAFLAASITLTTSAGLILGGLILPIIIMPITIAAIKYAPRMGEKFTKNIVERIPSIVKNSQKIDKIINQLGKEILPPSIVLNNELTPTLSQGQIKELTIEAKLNTLISKEKIISEDTKSLPLKLKSKNNGPSRGA